MSAPPRPGLYLVRHADAGEREEFVGTDVLRPLSPRGERQAELLAERLAAKKPALLVSSPARRCTETLRPLSYSTGLALEEADPLLEGADALAALSILLARSPSSERQVVACSHGDILVTIVEHLLAEGVGYDGKPNVAKGSTIEIALSPAGRPVHLCFVPAPRRKTRRADPTD